MLPPPITKALVAPPVVVVVIAPVVGAIVVIVFAVIAMPVIPAIVVAIPSQGRQRGPGKCASSGQRQYSLAYVEVLSPDIFLKATTFGLNGK